MGQPQFMSQKVFLECLLLYLSLEGTEWLWSAGKLLLYCRTKIAYVAYRGLQFDKLRQLTGYYSYHGYHASIYLAYLLNAIRCNYAVVCS